MKLIGFGLMMGGIAVGWLGMIYGWGLAPVSWPWIIGTSAAGMILVGAGQIVAEDR